MAMVGQKEEEFTHGPQTDHRFMSQGLGLTIMEARGVHV